jgi:hypothetical protein
VRHFDPVRAVGIDMNDNNALVARHDQLGLVKAGAVGLVGDFKWGRLRKEQCAGAATQGAQAEYDKQTGEYGCRQQKRHQAIEEQRPFGIGVEAARAQQLQVAQEQLELDIEQDRKKPHIIKVSSVSRHFTERGTCWATMSGGQSAFELLIGGLGPD